MVTLEAEGMSTTAGSQQQQKRQQLHDSKYSKSVTQLQGLGGKFATGAVDTYSSEYLPPL